MKSINMINQQEQIVQQFERVDSKMIGMCLNLECQEQDCYFNEQQLRDHQKVNQCRDYCKMIDEIELILEYLIYELKQQQLIQTDQQIELANYQPILSNLNQQQYKLITSQDIQYLKIQYNILNKQKDQNKIIQYCLQQGIQLIEQQNWHKALLYFTKISKQQQKNDIALFYLGVILLELNECSKSGKMIEKLKTEYPTFFENQITTMTKDQSINQNNLAQLLLIGHSLFQTKEYHSAIDISDRILQIDNDNINGLIGKIGSLIMLQQFEQAIQVQNNCLKTNINKSVLILFQGLLLTKQGQYNQAMTFFNHAIQIDPKFADAYYLIANLYLDQKKFEDAIIYFDKTIDLDPYHAEAFNNKGVALKQLKKYEEAFICFEKAIQSDPNNPFGHYNKGCSLIKTKNYVDAIICLNNALNLNPTCSSPQYEIGLSFYYLINRSVFKSPKLDKKDYHQLQDEDMQHPT
ncbi:unnamed protein product (macronuclear) [Paramecium tetraurelia]|uniref:Uncharacterized protein n=1 Tax=Paramecium tetraurelia TaxID=5888 RepID=A0C703_PARTE|nr:uncharacterized protein GSPATT00035699001 [Paramecium tetraurelia]CAK66570.1 unnamed protein product [Paramecium tetraurelia]|eukprot:XP_001433967.1 hypothetical protein (macronuclear) [Paramecium tetraurelia strain d4-2]